MRRQNPPQAYLDRAQNIEKYLSPLTLAAVYGMGGILYAVFISLIFGLLVYASVLDPSPGVVTIFSAIAFIPAIFAFLAWFLRPNDPLSSHIMSLAEAWRRPLNLPADECTFKTRFMDGEVLYVELSFYYPSIQQTAPVKERLYTYVHSALASHCAMRAGVPTHQEIENVLDRPLDVMATESGIPVLYLEIREVYSSHEKPVADDYLGTGTWN
jgi:hypothetical protein